MRNLLALLALLAIVLGGVGVWRGWYGVSGLPSDPGKFAFRLEVDAVKVGQDLSGLVQGLSQKLTSASPSESKPAGSIPAETP